MKILKGLFRFLFSRFLWTLIGVTVLCLLIWQFGAIISFGSVAPLASELTRVIVIGLIIVIWLVSMLVRQLRAARANRMFVTELAQAPEPEPSAPGDENVAEVNEKFQGILEQMKRSKLGGRKFLRDMPWYIFIGPPGTGKTTALRQSGLHFPIDLSDDLKGMGGTRNCDWFFTENAILVDTAGRYVEQQSDPEIDAAEWRGFLQMLRKHRGRRALNGVILTISLQELLGDEKELREHGREIRKRLAELRELLEIRLPVYLMVTKTDLVPGFEEFFDDLSTREREQVWGATLPTDARVDGMTVDGEIKALTEQLENRMTARLSQTDRLSDRALVFRFPAQVEALTAPLKLLTETVFGENKYEESPWLRGFYLTSATQEGSPIDRMLDQISGAFGLAAPAPESRSHGEKRSFFLREFMTDVVFREAGLGTFDPKAEERRRWIWRGTLAGASLVAVFAGLLFLFSYLRYSGGIADQERLLTALKGQLANVASRQAPVEPLDLDLALAAVQDVATARTEVSANILTVAGPTALPEIRQSQQLAYEHALKNILEPRMLALIEATMWREIRNPEFLLGAMKTYQMMTGLAPFDSEFAAAWWEIELPEHSPITPFPTEAARTFQVDALHRLALDEQKFDPDPRLVNLTLETICTVPLSTRAYTALMRHPSLGNLDDWVPAEFAGPNGAQVLSRLSEKTLRIGIPGAFTHDGFHSTILPLVPEVAAQAALDRVVFAGGCSENADPSVAEIENDLLKLYYEDYIAQWDSFMRDVRLTPITDLTQARNNLKDLSSTDSALIRLLTAVVAETHLARTEGEETAADAVSDGLLSAARKRLANLNKLAGSGATTISTTFAADTTGPPVGQPVSDHFAPLRTAIEESDGQPPLLDPAVAALTALSNELQTVAASPDPEAALLARGGLPQLIGAISNEAALLPDPLDDWLRGIAGDTITITMDAVIAQLNARWRADVLPFCVSATAGRYPFDQSSRIDVNTSDFARLFGPGGLIDSYTNDHLLPYINNTVRPWQWRADFNLPADRLTPFERARSIRDGLFPGGAGPVMAFTLQPIDLSPNASRVTLNLDGQTLNYFNSATRPEPMTWPGPDGTNLISLTFAPIDGAGEVISSETGDWAWLRMIRTGRMQKTELPELFRLTLGNGPYRAQYELRANSVDNPFDLEVFGSFQCPERI
ncbi:type VI secretion system membrane subunit TssM [Aliiroseovarius sp. YM-037]|uniref:type VI secretion system membrane subunit TssM n=1 Tax=Aliiroseovarius sp. YM-037 TaxID=3341728 RepID=UPI003A7FC801